MSRTVMNALRGMLPPRIADYVDAAISVSAARQEAARRQEITGNAGTLADLAERLAVLETENKVLRETLEALRYEDRLTLSRARLHRILAEMGAE